MGLGAFELQVKGLKLEMERHAGKTLEFQHRIRCLYLSTKFRRQILGDIGSLLKVTEFAKRLMILFSISKRFGGDDVVKGRDVQHEAIAS
jgi:hypothetical protein